MAKKLMVVVAVAMVLVAILVGRVVYSYLKPPATPSGSIQAIPLVLSTATATTGTAATSTQPSAAQATNTPVVSTPPSASQPSAAPSASAVTSSQPTATPNAGTQASAAPASSTQAAAAPTIYEIRQDSSEARYRVDEVLNGEPNTVVGVTNQVAGQIAVNPTAPATAQVGVIQINARTLATDSERRDAAVQNQVFKTGQHEFITFTPTSIVGLPQTATLGQSYSFQIVGQLTIAGNTRDATFDVTATPTTDGKLQGSAKATIKYADWGLSVPSAPFVASVEDTVILELEFVATPV